MVNTSTVHIPPDKDRLMIAGIGAVISGGLMVCDFKSSLTRAADPWFLFLISIIILLINCRDYILTDNEIVCRYFAIPLRKIKWSAISDAVLLNEWNDMGQIRKETILLVSMNPSLPYAENLFSVFSHRVRNPFHTIFVYVPKDATDSLALKLRESLAPEYFRDKRNTY